jgi:hypothetical protein
MRESTFKCLYECCEIRWIWNRHREQTNLSFKCDSFLPSEFFNHKILLPMRSFKDFSSDDPRDVCKDQVISVKYRWTPGINLLNEKDERVTARPINLCWKSPLINSKSSFKVSYFLVLTFHDDFLLSNPF